ncbi:hypothetical protein OG914_04215 [Streptomyces sp. NBC_00291]|uniref:hypothetical protein n=1 Tax=Streptomyces sp. NBC_00291 TaxID=2975704 RepID=UPI002254DA58|nr:hypothetical protein [Streptomyces sp. NBC_00291]MCX5153218.1 hypothetical protein [Streptomyces sp. NBC_00291]
MTDFEAYTHQQLLDMIASLDPSLVSSRARLLELAAKSIREIGNALRDHKVSGWEGEASLAYQNWVNSAGNATLRLADYSEAGSKWMDQASHVMFRAKSLTPDVSTTALGNLEAARKFHNDPDSAQIAKDAHAVLESDRLIAVGNLKMLAEAYDQSTLQMNAAEVPTFPPPPGEFVPQGRDGQTDLQRTGGGPGTGWDGSGTGPVTRSAGPGALPNEPGQQLQQISRPTSSTDPAPITLPGIPDRNVNVDLDSVGTLPDKTIPSATPMPGVVAPVSPGGGPVTPIGSIPPVAIPSVGGLVKPGGSLGPVGGSGLFPGTAAPGGKVGGVAGLPPRDSGIVGGRAVSSSGSGAGIPRGNVIGGEAGQTGRGMMGGGMGSGGGGGSHGASGGSAVGRRLATESGGVVGGRQPGSAGRSTTGGQPFTQGGSGLVRNGSGAGPGIGPIGHGGPGVRNPGRRRDGQGGERPDYLAEDEETWQADRRVVPPVID